MNPTISDLVSQYMKERGWKARQMAEHVQRFDGGAKVERQHIESLLKGEVKMPRYIEALALSMATTVDDLLSGEAKRAMVATATGAGKTLAGAKVIAEQLDAERLLVVQDRQASYVVDHNIPQYETGGSMGSGGLVLQDQPGMIKSWRVTNEWVQKNVHNFTSLQNLAIVTGFGDSMRPLYNPGDPLLVDRGVTKVEFDGIYFFRVGDEGFVKRLQRIPGNGLLAISENKSYRDWPIKKNMDFEVFARVVKVWRGEDF